MAGNYSNKLTIEERLSQLLQANEIAQSEAPKIQCKIQRVPHHLRDRKHFTQHYTPKLLSFGPIHHGDAKLQLGERYKQMWAAKYIHSTKNPETLHSRVQIFIQDLINLFDADLFTSNDLFLEYHNQGFGNMEEMICWTLFVEGCALLHILENAHLSEPYRLSVKVEELIHVMRDVLLLENQLPYLLLKLLWRNADDEQLIQTMELFLWYHVWPVTDDDEARLMFKSTRQPIPPTHLLDLQRSIILRIPDHANHKEDFPNGNNDMTLRYRNIKELKAAGIGLKKGKTRNPSDIYFSHGWLHSELRLPEIVVNDITADLIFNLTAYERCHDFENDYGICSYYSFLDSLIDNSDDVKELKSQGILLNSLRSDEEVANFFNTLGTALVPEKGTKYCHVRAQIERHYSHKSLPTWLSLAYHTYFSNPWTIIAFQGAILGLVLTFIQTWYAIHPAK